jgi:hypothetical protein
MAENDDEKRRQEEEARIREILGSRTPDNPQKKRELEEKRAEAENQRKTGNFGLLLLILVVLSVLFAVVRYLMES